MTHAFALRDFQARACSRVRGAWRCGARRILLVSPTGSGKSRMGCEIVAGAVAKGGRVLWLVHRQELVFQASATLDRLGVRHGVALSGHDRDLGAPVVVASVQTLTARGAAPDGVTVVVVDEAHHATCDTYRAIIGVYPALVLLLGLTATPERADRSPMGDVFDELVVATRTLELVGLGLLVPCDVVHPPAKLGGIAQPVAEAYLAHLRGRPTIAFVRTVREARALVTDLAPHGVRAACVDGKTADAARADAIARLHAGELDVLTNVFTLTEGTDIPPVSGILVGRGCSAWSTWIQMVGRGRRTWPGKTDCKVVDLRGVIHEHGSPDDERAFSLEGVASKAPDGMPTLVSCLGCALVFRRDKAVALGRDAMGEDVVGCPNCSRALPPPKPPKVTRAPLGSFPVATAAEQWAEFEKLERYRRARGYAAKFTGVRFLQKFGFWPRFRAADVKSDVRRTA